MVPRETSWFYFPERPEKHQLSEKKKTIAISFALNHNYVT